jgi:hypothetical protein
MIILTCMCACVLTQAGDLHHVFNDAAARTPGAIWMIDLASTPATAAERVPVRGIPSAIPFNPHGIYFSRASGLLYCVSHGFAAGGSRIIILRALFDDKATAANGKVGTVRSLEYVRSVTSPLFRTGAINDVVEGAAPGELYVTEWLQYEYPVTGKRHPQTAGEKARLGLQSVAQMAYKGTSVLRCTYAPDAQENDGAAQCAIAASGFYMANGITKRPSDHRIYVNDATGARLRTFARDALTGALTEGSSAAVVFAMDNVEYDTETGAIHAGNMPIAHKVLARMGGDDSVAVPGGLSILTEDANGAWRVDNSALMHSGEKLSQISSAVRWRGTTLLGSPFSRGFLVCRA